jgi:leader peptidase (prepilin peptidase)/N-methyltransferase
VEGLNAGLYLFLAWYLNFGWFFFVYAFLSSILLVIFFIDLDFQIIPDILTLPGIVIGLAVSFLPDGIGIVSSLIGLAIGGGVLYLMAVLGEKIFKKESMGGGDIKMAAMLGAFLGWQKVVLIFFGGALIGVLVSVVAMSFSAKIRQSRLIPFGPFLAVAAFGAIVFGDFLINYYLNNFLAV